jgi:hypothetical protein
MSRQGEARDAADHEMRQTLSEILGANRLTTDDRPATISSYCAPPESVLYR